ncbi:MAG: GtrA family protein [Bacteroidota bacterium]
MKRHIHSVRDFIIAIIDFFYPPFRKLMNLQTFRYAACGSGNVVLGLILYTVMYKYILKEETLHFGFYAFKAHVAALFTGSLICFFVGFFLMKFVVFNNSILRTRVQFFRYLMQWLFFLMVNYILLKIFVERFHIYPVFAQILTTAIVVLFSYLSQKYYTFKTDPAGETKNSG